MTRFSSLAVAAAMVVSSATATLADSFFFDDSTVSASGQQMTVTRLPVRKPDGTVVYRDVTLNFVVNSAGQVVVKSSKTINSPPQIVFNGKFEAGKYYLAAKKEKVFDVVGPQIGVAGRAMWSIRLNGATVVRIYPGPVKGHPYEAEIKQSGVKSDLAYGVTDDDFGSGFNDSHNIPPDSLIGAQYGNGEITISDFGPLTGLTNRPLGTVVLARCKATDAC